MQSNTPQEAETEVKVKPVANVKARAVRQMIEHLEKQEAKWMRRIDQMRFSVLRGRDHIQSLKKVLKEREDADNKPAESA